MNKSIRKYIVFTYLAFYLFIGFIGLMMYIFDNAALTTVLQTISAWTPSFVFLLLFKKIYPRKNRLHFILGQFTEKISPKIILAAIGIPLTIFGGALVFAAFLYKTPVHGLIIATPLPFFYTLPFHLSSGPLGEELGWRAFLLTEFQKRTSPVKSGLIVGLIWAFWHLPLWLVSGYGGSDLVIYIASFLVSIVCCSLIISILYSKCRNLLIAIIIHLMNNYLLGLFTMDPIQYFPIAAGSYLIVTFLFALANRPACFQSKNCG